MTIEKSDLNIERVPRKNNEINVNNEDNKKGANNIFKILMKKIINSS